MIWDQGILQGWIRENGSVYLHRSKARFRCRSTHVLNLTDELSTAKERCLNQFGTAVSVWCGKSVSSTESAELLSSNLT